MATLIDMSLCGWHSSKGTKVFRSIGKLREIPCRQTQECDSIGVREIESLGLSYNIHCFIQFNVSYSKFFLHHLKGRPCSLAVIPIVWLEHFLPKLILVSSILDWVEQLIVHITVTAIAPG